jgi:hypothetical protein
MLMIMEAPPHLESPISVCEGHVELVLLDNESSTFYLTIPLNNIRAFCKKPWKYLMYLGWCIFDSKGKLAGEHCEEINKDRELDAQ